MQRSPEAWQRFVRFSNKTVVAELVDGEDAFLLTEFFGGEPYHRPVACIGHDRFPNGRFCLDLTVDPDALKAMPDDDLHHALARKGSPVRRVRTNGAPTLTLLHEAEDHLLEGFDPYEIEERGRRLRADAALCERLIASYTASWGQAEPSPHPELRLVSDGFPSDDDKDRCTDFHDALWRRRPDIVRRLEDPRLQAFGRQLLYNEHRSLLSEVEQTTADLELAARLLDERDGPLTLGNALAEVQALIADDIGDPTGNLAGYRDYLTGRINAAEAFRRQHSHSPV
jgi:exodeoxyribonuclease-1